MRNSFGRAMALALASSLSTAAVASSDYLLQIGGRNDAATSPSSIEVNSFSWGASNPTSVGSSGMSGGKVNVQDLSVMSSAAPRDMATGQASGKRTASVAVSGAPGGTVASSSAVEPKPGDVTTLSLTAPESALLQSACATGKHFPSATLSGKRTVQMSDVIVTSCALDGAMRKYELTGHVTLMK